MIDHYMENLAEAKLMSYVNNSIVVLTNSDAFANRMSPGNYIFVVHDFFIKTCGQNRDIC